MLRERGKHLQLEPVSVRIVAAYEVCPALHERGDESGVATQTVKLGNDQRRFLPAAFLQGRKELRAVSVLLPALDFRVLGGGLAGSGVLKHGGPLRFQS